MTKRRATAMQYYNRDNRRLLGWLSRLDLSQKQPMQKPSNKGRSRIPGRKPNYNVKIKRIREPRLRRRVDFKQNGRVVRNMWIPRRTIYTPRKTSRGMSVSVLFLFFKKRNN